MQSSITHFKAWKKGKVWLYSASLITFLLLGAVTTQLAMAVSPIINGFTNTSSIIIAYAATNPYFNEINDWITDIETVVGGSQYFVPLNGGPTLQIGRASCRERV